ncbi:hypothetical protein AtNW77_Chr3g0201661 [Arabidopsis thaliana]
MGSYFLVFTFSFVRFLPILTVGQTSGLGFIRLSQQVDRAVHVLSRQWWNHLHLIVGLAFYQKVNTFQMKMISKLC